ncbi:MAG: translation initiation factor 2 [Pseudomonas sp.]|nr:MAG: translation initiation factor 2 [Pseudomonas sp.]
MRPGPLYLLLSVLACMPIAHAEELQSPAAVPPVDTAGQIIALQQQLAESERQRNALQTVASGEHQNAQIARLRQDNQRLRLQLKQAQASQAQGLLSEQQLWFAIGGGTTLCAFIVGRLSAGRNRRRSEWI